MPNAGRQGDLPPTSPPDDPRAHSSGTECCEAVEGLTSWTVSEDGDRIRLGFEDGVGRRRGFDLPFDAVSSLLLTTPRMLRTALRAQGNRSARVVQPLGAWSVERAAHPGCLILTLSALSGFDVAFAVAPHQLAAMSEAADSADVSRDVLN